MNDVKIEPCPMLGCASVMCLDYCCDKGRKYDFWIECACGYRTSRCLSEPQAIAAHNAFCALVEKGRTADEHMKRFVTNQKLLTDTIDYLATAVRLLEILHKGLNSPDSPAARFDAADFLALDAITKIREQGRK